MMTWRFIPVSQLFNELFKNNANRSEMAEKRHNQNYFMEMTTVDGVYDYLMYVGKFLPLFIPCYSFITAGSLYSREALCCWNEKSDI